MVNESNRWCLLFGVIVMGVVGCAPSDNAEYGGVGLTLAIACPESTTLDNAGQPRNVGGHIRYCWPTEANCYCDSDDDCYARDGYVACTPRGAAATPADTGSATDASTPPAPDSGTATNATGTCPLEARSLDRAGQPRNAEGHIRYCWPDEARCSCDRDNDCYALDGYVACVASSGTTMTTTRDAGGTMSTVSDSGTMASGSPGTDVLPAFDSATDAHVRSVISIGVSRGNRPNVFAKIGDSITESASFLSDIGFGWYTLGNHADVLPAIQRFTSVTLSDGSNSFNRASVCAVAGWTTGDALAGGTSSPLMRELEALRPMFAIVMYGTNDMDRSDLTTYTANMNTIVDTIEARGTVAILSTIPPRTDSASRASLVTDYNTAVRSIARTRHLPLIDYYVAMSPLPAQGISNDGIHPSLYLDQGGTLTDTALRYGYNVRNLTALQMLLRLTAY